MATWTSRGMDKFLCEDFGMASISEYYGRFVSIGKNIYKVGFSEQTRQIKIWKYNIKENLPWKEISTYASTFHFPLPMRSHIRFVVAHGTNIFVFMRRNYGNLMYDFIPVFSVETEAWAVHRRRVGDMQVPDLDGDAVTMSACLVGDDFFVYSSASFDNFEDFHPKEHGGTDRFVVLLVSDWR